MQQQKKILPFCFVLLSAIFILSSCAQKPVELEKELSKIPDVELRKMELDSEYFTEKFLIMLTQPLDHDDSSAGTFQQRMFLSHAGFDRPVVLITEGYAAGRNNIQELAEILKANQLQVEYRYFGESRPDEIDWDHLNYHQSSHDYNHIVFLFKKIYKGKWISTGWSKGGQTALIFRRFFPDDVHVTVAYDAPICLSQEDPRIDEFFEKVGTAECRQRLIDFQRMILENKEEVLPLYEYFCKEKGYSFNYITPLKAFEYTALEYPFSFWQYHKIDCGTIPSEGAGAQEMFDHLKMVVNLSAYRDSAFNSISMKQFATELGYYGYVTKYVKDLLSEGEDDYPNKAFAPQDVDLTFNPGFMQDIQVWLLNHGNNIIYIYGENDPWSAPHLGSTAQTNALMVWVEGGNHFSFIRSLSQEKQDLVLATLNRWLQ